MPGIGSASASILVFAVFARRIGAKLHDFMKDVWNLGEWRDVGAGLNISQCKGEQVELGLQRHFGPLALVCRHLCGISLLELEATRGRRALMCTVTCTAHEVLSKGVLINE